VVASDGFIGCNGSPFSTRSGLSVDSRWTFSWPISFAVWPLPYVFAAGCDRPGDGCRLPGSGPGRSGQLPGGALYRPAVLAEKTAPADLQVHTRADQPVNQVRIGRQLKRTARDGPAKWNSPWPGSQKMICSHPGGSCWNDGSISRQDAFPRSAGGPHRASGKLGIEGDLHPRNDFKVRPSSLMARFNSATPALIRSVAGIHAVPGTMWGVAATVR
jgi:hypothetical protein